MTRSFYRPGRAVGKSDVRINGYFRYNAPPVRRATHWYSSEYLRYYTWAYQLALEVRVTDILKPFQVLPVKFEKPTYEWRMADGTLGLDALLPDPFDFPNIVEIIRNGEKERYMVAAPEPDRPFLPVIHNPSYEVPLLHQEIAWELLKNGCGVGFTFPKEPQMGKDGTTLSREAHQKLLEQLLEKMNGEFRFRYERKK